MPCCKARMRLLMFFSDSSPRVVQTAIEPVKEAHAKTCSDFEISALTRRASESIFFRCVFVVISEISQEDLCISI